MQRSTIDLWVGMFVVAGVLALGFLSMKVANVGTGGKGDVYVVKALFENIGGLTVRAPVRSAGVTVGRVTDISLDKKEYQALVTMSIDKRYEFPKDTFAAILTSGILGENYIGLNAGGDDAMLKDGDGIKKTQSAVVLENLIGQFLFNKAQESGTQKK
jgi:phospholipid/cholesterol/gamma-HCH transport system substrate-binding protein